MQFLSLIVLAFVFLAVLINALIDKRYRMCWLLFCSFVFISYFSWPAAITVIVLSVFNFYTGPWVAASKGLYLFNLFVNSAALIIANYVIAFGRETGLQFQLIGFSVHPALLTLGLSFYTLQHIAYIVDCRLGRQVPAISLSAFLFASSFFPKFLSGPLTKYNELNNQRTNDITKADYLQGFNRMLLGVFKKMVIADRLAPGVHSVFDFPDSYSGLTVFLGAVLFTIQLYFDFSGYTDIALGIARMLGFWLPENFDQPFRSGSVTEFWRRWHISLICFFTGYIFYPLSYRFRRHKYFSASAGITLTFLLSGLWHGLGLPFLLWSLCHLVYLQLELATRKWRNTGSVMFKTTGWLLTLLAVSFSNVFFRSTGTSNLLQHWNSLIHHFMPLAFTADVLAPLAVGGQQADLFNLWLSVILAVLFLLFEKRIETTSRKPEFSMPYVLLILLLICLFGIFASGEQFIYVQF